MTALRCSTCTLGGVEPLCPKHDEGATTCIILDNKVKEYDTLLEDLDDIQGMKGIIGVVLKKLLIRTDMNTFTNQCKGYPKQNEGMPELTAIVNLLKLRQEMNMKSPDQSMLKTVEAEILAETKPKT